ncbi:MAG: helix-turn-helix domain-containing protein [Ferruginibacter sp.]|nr:helix-turn-helix domain-containing protein [Cytophagales bacterium]
MHYLYQDTNLNGRLLLFEKPADLKRAFFKDRNERLLTIAWNTGDDQLVNIDGVSYPFPRHTVLPLMVNQSFAFNHPERLIAWQFNREFYCIVDHDKEVSCVGFLFYGSSGALFVKLDETEQRRFAALFQVFADEFSTRDNIQGEMLRMLLKRLIIKVTRLGKEQSLAADLPEVQLDLVRQFNLLVEHHYRHKHRVADYADLLHRSPKTLTNLFAVYNQKSPLQVIHDRVMLEAKRLLLYTDKNNKEIAHDLGFEEVAHFGRFFKSNAGLPPGEFKHTVRPAVVEKPADA